MRLFVPTEDPASESDTYAALLVPYHPDYPCLRQLAAGPDAPAGDEEAREVRHGNA